MVLTTLTLIATPRDLSAVLELEANITASESPARLHYTKELVSVPIPDAGLSMTGILSVGGHLSYNVDITASIQGTASIGFGSSTGISNSAKITADVKDLDSSTATGFDGYSFTPLFDVKGMSASVTLSVYSQPKLAFGIELLKTKIADVDISVKLPEVNVDLIAAYGTHSI